MNPYISLQLARQRGHELRAEAERYRQHLPRRRRSVRHRAGRALVTVGLALARESGEA